MPKKESTSRKRSNIGTALSTRTKKQIDSLPEHAQHIFKKVHANGVKHYQDPAKRSNCPSHFCEGNCKNITVLRRVIGAFYDTGLVEMYRMRL
jgi:hypothetical protein